MPEFAPGSVHNAVATFHNPKSAGFDYSASFCMGTDWAEMAIASFHLNGGQSKGVQFPVTMPSAFGEYPVGFKVSSGGKLIGTLADPVTVSIVGVAEFAYVSGMRKELWTGPYGTYVRCSVDIKNIGAVAGVCSISGHGRINITGCGWSGWNPFQYYDLQSATLQPGEIATFGGSIIKYYIAGLLAEQHMIQSPAGIILDPPTPGLYLCRICYDLYGTNVYFDTQAQLDAHIVSAHPQYLPMPPLTHFTLKGLSWPDHFTMYGEDYGKITHWHAIACLAGSECPSGEGWDSRNYVAPDDGEVYRSTGEACEFTMPNGWVSAIHDAGGIIPNSTILRFYFQTDQGWSGFLGDRGAQRLPDRAMITFSVSSGGLSGLQIT